MRAIDADALQLAIVEEGQANKRKKYIIGDIWELTGAEIREVINSQPTIHPELGTNLAEVGTDCISRQAAINALRMCYDTETITMDNGDEYIDYGDAVNEIEQLPPAQPEQLEQCPIYGGMCAYPSDQCYDCPRHAGAKMEVTT